MAVQISIQGGASRSGFGSLKERLDRAAHYKVPNSVYMFAAARIIPVMTAALSEAAPYNKNPQNKWRGLPSNERDPGSLKAGFDGEVISNTGVGQIRFTNKTSYANFVENGHYTRPSREVNLHGRRASSKARTTYSSQWFISADDFVGRAINIAMPTLVQIIRETGQASNELMFS